jgi:SNF2 family DNA or RNA helicase
MGLGKTLTMIALAATDLESGDFRIDTHEDCLVDIPATLIVVPPPCKCYKFPDQLSLS